MTNKTALEMLIETLQGRIDSLPEYAKKHDMAVKGIISGLHESIKEATNLLPTERKDLERAFRHGQGDMHLVHGVITNKSTASDYYNKTFKDGE